MCGGIHYGRLRDWSLWRGGLVAEVLHVWWNSHNNMEWTRNCSFKTTAITGRWITGEHYTHTHIV